jgi:hypothetical protein
LENVNGVNYYLNHLAGPDNVTAYNNVDTGFLTTELVGPRPKYKTTSSAQAYAASRDIAPWCRVSASSQWDDLYHPEFGIDNRSSSIWASGAGDPLPRYYLKFQRSQKLSSVQLTARQDLDQADTRKNITIYGVTPSNTWVILGTRGSTPFGHRGTWTININSSQKYDWIVIQKNNGAHFNFSSVNINAID